MSNVPIVSRAQWGAKAWRSTVHRVSMREKVAFLVHYHGGSVAQQVGVAVPRNVERIHLANGWAGVGYNFLVDQDGVAYEGRGWDGVGSQCPGFNRSGIGVYVAVGGSQKPSDAALNTVRALYDEGCRRSGNALRKMGHRDGVATACPGTILYAWVKDGMPSAGYTGGGGMTAPTPSKPKPAPKPDPKPKRQKVEVDGWLGRKTITQWQLDAGTEPDGVISYPRSSLVVAEQERLNRKGVRDRKGKKLVVDGKGVQSNENGRYPHKGSTSTLEALQRELGTTVDGALSAPSDWVKAKQRQLNARVK